jgi:hypothetical protein
MLVGSLEDPARFERNAGRLEEPVTHRVDGHPLIAPVVARTVHANGCRLAHPGSNGQ